MSDRHIRRGPKKVAQGIHPTLPGVRLREKRWSFELPPLRQ
ncbi:hypothetical protein RISK_001660 [Rhodopirellula islandica]|uniref:Uncharacterized protein n=1 Tax=Rhodopirellula islandica TaxID=595434 RepID=A0A0J1ELQ4_RHOIS|nr:hypothetical protein RISK_001660 [Rhodopirellula islandica]